jgi:hypothetical protein
MTSTTAPLCATLTLVVHSSAGMEFTAADRTLNVALTLATGFNARPTANNDGVHANKCSHLVCHPTVSSVRYYLLTWVQVSAKQRGYGLTQQATERACTRPYLHEFVATHNNPTANYVSQGSLLPNKQQNNICTCKIH